MEIIALLGFAFIAVGVGHELTWRQRLARSRVVPGTIVEIDRYDDHAEVEYFLDDQRRRFVSGYSVPSNMIWVGKRVSVAADPDSGDAEIISFSNRWVFTIVPILAGLFAMWFGICIENV